MRTWLFLLTAISMGAAFTGGARAEERTLEYRAVVHATEVHTTSVPGQEGHEVGVAAFRGLAIFDDGRIANHWYSGTLDFVEGSGPIEGYALWVFDDGARLRSRYSGTAKATAEGGITFEGRHAELTGSGAYAGVRGEGSFAGERINHLRGDEGDTYQRGVLKLSLPAR
jgi:hypothetical protein